MNLRKRDFIGITAATLAATSFFYLGNISAGIWATLTAIANYIIAKQNARIRKMNTLQINLNKFLEKAEVKEIKELLKSLDNFESKSD